MFLADYRFYSITCKVFNVKFRKDLNGLRAIAVIPVVLFHFNASWFPGGFAGVDVFFVISGYLMTAIIFRGIEQDNFSILDFYITRANRLIPALAFLCLVLLVFGWFFTFDETYRTISKHVISSLSFLSNVAYSKESGYFDAGSHAKWLLHTWSLSTEFQFYITYPLILVALRKIMRIELLKVSILLGVILGFILCIISTYKWPDLAYYLLSTRVWELMFGGLAYLYPINIERTKAILLKCLGLTFILGTYLFISIENLWPGYLSIFPVLGTFFIIQANKNNSFILDHIIFQKIGTWSYSIYLWHWPLVVFMYNYMNRNTSNIIFLISLSILLGAVSHRLIEKKVKGKNAVLLFILTLFLSVMIYINDGNFGFRAESKDPRNNIISTYSNLQMDPSGLFKKCNAAIQMRDTGSPQVDKQCVSSKKGGLFLWGDSHIGALSTGLRFELPEDVPFSQLTSSGCAPSFIMQRTGSNRFSKGCNYSNSIAYSAILKTSPKIVILGVHANHEKYDWQKTIVELYDMGVSKVIVIGPLPQWRPSLPLVYVRRHMDEKYITDFSFDKSLIESNNFLAEQHDVYNNFIFINILSRLCTGLGKGEPSCRAKIGDSLMAFDYGHLTVEGSRFIAESYVIPLL